MRQNFRSPWVSQTLSISPVLHGLTWSFTGRGTCEAGTGRSLGCRTQLQSRHDSHGTGSTHCIEHCPIDGLHVQNGPSRKIGPIRLLPFAWQVPVATSTAQSSSCRQAGAPRVSPLARWVGRSVHMFSTQVHAPGGGADSSQAALGCAGLAEQRRGIHGSSKEQFASVSQ